jgi:hypothetical protein
MVDIRVKMCGIELARIPKLTFAEFPLFADLADSFRLPSAVEYLCRPDAAPKPCGAGVPACYQAF